MKFVLIKLIKTVTIYKLYNFYNLFDKTNLVFFEGLSWVAYLTKNKWSNSYLKTKKKKTVYFRILNIYLYLINFKSLNPKKTQF